MLALINLYFSIHLKKAATLRVHKVSIPFFVFQCEHTIHTTYTSKQCRIVQMLNGMHLLYTLHF